ncbi:class I SAM-dependent methyltransferase [Blastococcus sp. CT_GayMR16]|uniref:class I SAM-dependent methyltransferase n=1 Tax=Blastococcus sp. CT_GayMR16 TaxID=2559607 RepID=UPI001073ABED|nr:class I SAM-dependent methyltransferase [Blastococcus sp. CT_GayMR16]TFV89415.1 class I SAM-dependent methyltransferase [Blastococcus sp. CT_GayMR16]
MSTDTPTIDAPTIDAPTIDDGAATDAFVGRLFESALGAMDLFTIGLGSRLGLYAALQEHGPQTSTELAAHAGVAERYAREWLEQQAVTGILEVGPGSAAERRYTLPEAVVPVLLEPTHPAYLAPLAALVPPLGTLFERLVEVYRTGEGVSWSEFPAEAVEAQAALNRPAFTHELGGWLAAVPEIDERLSAGPSRIADLGCGGGWSTQALARRYPEAVVHGFDIDDASIAMARRSVAGSEVEERVAFEVCDLAGPADIAYDAATMFEALHDLSHPVQVLTSIRRSLVPGGILLVADERAADTFTAPGDPFERLFYASSVLVCLPGSLADGGVGTGAAIRPSTVRSYAEQAGFASCEVAPIDSPMFRFYLLRAPA